MEWIVEAETREDLVDGLWTGGKRLVRCKDCKYYWKNSKYEDDMDAVAMCLASPEDDAFCSEGERKQE